ncbi:hypothetical protein THASP1DRAFT_32019 [Thamnocephalis sphaerospora]|uniref:Uncharacterized protein n=1 Tax=Thamnocephalis sphaerospora TaxID=78915 RepID=A0A4P9XK37_9FUNG|nr:hypothetical protein THASP1DRAFT_32019 [Thamnocephalis sphaerospora]|eukprot:RKP06154.1 hypothetical protein THASP1DRAFT_32019 [Thamnocephalis sphaerospora]
MPGTPTTNAVFEKDDGSIVTRGGHRPQRSRRHGHSRASGEKHPDQPAPELSPVHVHMEQKPVGRGYEDTNNLINAADSLYHTIYTLPAALLLLGALEYSGYSYWFLQPVFLALLAGQIMQAFRNTTTYHGRLLIDIGETTSLAVLVLSSLRRRCRRTRYVRHAANTANITL